MSIIRKIVSALVLIAGIVVLVGLCMNDSMEIVWQAFKDAISPFDFQNFTNALSTFFMITGNSIVLIMLGFIGLTMPSKQK